MPITRIDLRKGKSLEFKATLTAEIHEAMRETFDVPENSFVVITEHDEDTFTFSRIYRGVEHSDDLVIIQITANNTRTIEKKKALYAQLAERLGRRPGVRPQDVVVNILEVAKENWSLGNGLAQYA